MKVKNINPLERHVEKITLAVAAAAAIYLGYSSLSAPITTGEGSNAVAADQVEAKVTSSVQKLQAAMATSGNVDFKPSQNFVAQYKKLQSEPFDKSLTAEIAAFVPVQVSATGTLAVSDGGKHAPIVIPTIPAPMDVHAVANRGVVNTAPLVAANTPPAAPDIRDANWVKIEATYPMLKLLESFANKNGKIEETLPGIAQRITFTRVEVQRQEKTADGWSPWTDVPGLKLQPTPNIDLASLDNTAIPQALDLYDQNVVPVLMPVFWPILSNALNPAPATPRTAVKRTPEQESELMKTLDEIKRRKDQATQLNGPRTPPSQRPRSGAGGGDPRYPSAPGGGGDPRYPSTPGGAGANLNPPRPAPRTTPPSTTLPPDIVGGVPLPGTPGGMPYMNPSAPPGGAPEFDPAHQAQAAQNLKTQPDFNTWVWDTEVKPEHEYKYRMRVVVWNPTYHYPDMFPLKDPSFRNKPTLVSEWVDAAESVKIEPNQQFFLISGVGNGRDVNVKIYQWNQGKIVADEENVAPGLVVGKARQVAGFDKPIDFSTGYTVVDVRPEGRSTAVVLLNPAGQLVTRDLLTDNNDPKRKDLEEKYRRGIPAPGAASAVTGPIPPLTRANP